MVRSLLLAIGLLALPLTLACGPDEGDGGGTGGTAAATSTGTTAAGGTSTGTPAGQPDHWQDGLGPDVNWGIAADYPDDVGIGSDPYVLAAEDFETGTVTIPTEEDRYVNNVTVTDQQHYTGQYAGQHAWPEGHNGPTTRFVLTADAHQEQRPAYFMRMYFKYDDSFHPGDPSVGVGVKGFGIYYEDGSGDASTCEGMSWYNTSCQFVGWGPSSKPEANDGYIWEGHMYSYNPYPEQAVAAMGDLRVTDPPDGTQPCRFSIYPEPHHYIVYQTWHCYELGLYLNTPGQHDGESRFWVDGVLRSRTTHMRFRDLEEQLPTSMHLNLHRTTEDFPQTMIRWADNIVLARRYIGPVQLSQ